MAALAGISSLPDGKKYYGVFPLRRKLLNAREANHKQLTANKEIKNIIKGIKLIIFNTNFLVMKFPLACPLKSIIKLINTEKSNGF